jgi:hypothetical protein
MLFCPGLGGRTRFRDRGLEPRVAVQRPQFRVGFHISRRNQSVLHCPVQIGKRLIPPPSGCFCRGTVILGFIHCSGLIRLACNVNYFLEHLV